ncbi:MAG: hypothetical protein JNK10_11785 [Cyclobacteriaceae bacterium]|nr:hypothetical protein [Cyclobacteriaceae bacterium]
MKLTRQIVNGLLLLNAVGALAGGLMLMIDPTGQLIQMPFHWIEKSFFDDYFIPGLILFLFNGVLSCLTIFMTVGHRQQYERWVQAQGIVLMLWIIVQVLLLQMIYFLHPIMFGVGALLFVCGTILHRRIGEKNIKDRP